MIGSSSCLRGCFATASCNAFGARRLAKNRIVYPTRKCEDNSVEPLDDAFGMSSTSDSLESQVGSGSEHETDRGSAKLNRTITTVSLAASEH